jgi:hypothetical protein
MQKQAQYDQGVQKIQSYIDNVAGMEILNGADKEYLQSKLNQLGSKLTSVAGGDFSNQQLVSAVGGMAGQIIKDDNIQNAVFSTANAKKQQQRIDADLKNGKLNKAGEYIYNKELDKYMSNKEVGQRFTGQYRPRTSEYDKKMLDTIKALQPKLTQQDIAYSTNPLTGKLDVNLVAEVMQRYTDKRVDEGQIRTALNAVLNADDLEAMREDGIYNYRQYSEKDVASLIEENANKNFEIGAARLKQLKTQLPGITDPDQLLETKKLIAEYEREIGDPYMDIPSALRMKQQNSIAELADPNKLDQVKSQIFLKNTIDQYSNAFAYAEVKNELMRNPVAQERRDQRDEEFRRQVEANNQYDKAFNRDMKKKEYILAEEKAGRERGEYEQKMNPDGTPVFTGVGDETEQKRQSVINWMKDKQSYQNQNSILKNQLKDAMGGMFNDLTEAEVDAKIEAYKKNPAKNKPDDNRVKEIMDSYLANERYIAKKDIMLNEATKKATAEITGGKGIVGLMEGDLRKMPNITLTKGGKTITYTPQEILEYLSTKEYARVVTQAGAAQGGSSLSVRDELLSPKERLLKEALGARYVSGSGTIDYQGAGGGTFSGTKKKNAFLETELAKYNALTAKYKGVVSQIADKKVEILSPYAGAFKTEGAGITFTGKEGNNKQNLIDQLRNVVSNDLRQKGGGKNYDAKELLETLSKKGADAVLGFGVERQGNAYYIQVQDDSGDFQNIPVSRDFISKNLGAEYLNKAADTQMQMFSLGGNTNPTKNVELSQYAPNDFGNYDSGQKSVTLDIYANLRDQGNGNAAVTFNLKNKRGEVIPIVWPGRTGITSVEGFPQWLKQQTDETLLAKLRQLYPGVDNFLNK